MSSTGRAEGTKKSYNAAYYVANRERILARVTAYRATNPEKIAVYRAAYREAHREEFREGSRSRARDYRAANPEGPRASNAAWAKANPERARAYTATYRAGHPEKRAAYYAAHPETCRAASARHRVRKLGALGVATVAEIAARWAMYGDKCWVCGGVATATDHVKPLSKGGSNWPANLRPACGPCNSSKGATWPLAVAA